jgi:hypothetical protein
LFQPFVGGGVLAAAYRSKSRLTPDDKLTSEAV